MRGSSATHRRERSHERPPRGGVRTGVVLAMTQGRGRGGIWPGHPGSCEGRGDGRLRDQRAPQGVWSGVSRRRLGGR